MQESLVVGFEYILGMLIFIYQGWHASLQLLGKLIDNVFRGLSLLTVARFLGHHSGLHIEDIIEDLLGFLFLEGNVRVWVESEDLWLLRGG